ncbi:site-specific DNA-methyltransferase [Inquilinus limosus]|uniref:site-specific DNA-methyltransferase (adenine-specific) n=1 Tax=Inquilinus limosus TaxID=171674 RepID=A0A211ZQU4_9PROT|nr:site-specific DNA-methyltransferase [Inquilinus limosus]OWJ67467.1 site-specific DNA-methyltransferase [Inquilinus limosus]
MNHLYFGDNLDVLREHIKDETVDLVYLDPPFNSNATYNLLFRSASGRQADAQIEAFDDTWHWGDAAAGAYHDVIRMGSDAAGLLRSLRSFLGESDVMAYLAMMTVRLMELHRCLRPTASLCLHCDPTSSHYLKIILDSIFGSAGFKNEIIWKRTSSKSNYSQGTDYFPRVHDSILFYGKTSNAIFAPIFIDHEESYIKSKYPYLDEEGRRYGLWDMTGPGGAAKGNPSYEVLGVTRYWRYSKERMDQMIRDGRVLQSRPGAVPREKRYLECSRGVAVGDVWVDIPPVNSQAQERIGYPTQKPLALLERIVSAASRPGDLVLDPFCGCGTAVHAAQKLDRRWIGIDVTHLAIEVIEGRIVKAFDRAEFDVIGRPTDFEGAVELARRNKHQFQIWAIWLAQGTPYQDGKKGRDRGVDGQRFFPTGSGDVAQALMSVKGGDHLNPAMVRDLRGTIEREGAACGLLILLRPPTREMEREAAAAGMTDLPGRPVARIQIRTVAQLLDRNGFDLPVSWGEPMQPAAAAAREKKAIKRRKIPDPRQREMLLPTKGGKDASEGAAHQSVAASAPTRRARQGR